MEEIQVNLQCSLSSSSKFELTDEDKERLIRAVEAEGFKVLRHIPGHNLGCEDDEAIHFLVYKKEIADENLVAHICLSNPEEPLLLIDEPHNLGVE